MITINDYNTRFPKLNSDYFDSLNDTDKQTYINRLCRYHDKLLDILISKLNLNDIEQSLKNSDSCFKPVVESEYDLYQQLALGKLEFLYLRNNLYIERLNKEELAELDDNKKDITDLVNKTFSAVINDYPNQEMVTNYGPDSSKLLTKSSNLIMGIRIDEDYFPENINRTELLLKRNSELGFLKYYLDAKIEQNLGIEGSVLIYTDYSVKKLEKKTEIEETNITR